MVGNGDSLFYSNYCPHVDISFRFATFSLPFYILPIHGVWFGFGIQWLQTLDPFLSNYSIPNMQFYQDGKLIILTGHSSSKPTWGTYSQIRRFLSTDSIVSLHTFTLYPLTSDLPPSTPAVPTDAQIHPDNYHPDIFSLYPNILTIS